MDTKIKPTVLFKITHTQKEKYIGIIPTCTGFVYWKLQSADKISQRRPI